MSGIIAFSAQIGFYALVMTACVPAFAPLVFGLLSVFDGMSEYLNAN